MERYTARLWRGLRWVLPALEHLFLLSTLHRVATITAAVFTIVGVLYAIQFFARHESHDFKWVVAERPILAHDIEWLGWIPPAGVERQLVDDLNVRYEFPLALAAEAPRILDRVMCLHSDVLPTFRTPTLLEPRQTTELRRHVPQEIVEQARLRLRCKNAIQPSVFGWLTERYPDGVPFFAVAIASQSGYPPETLRDAIQGFQTVKWRVEVEFTFRNEGNAAATGVAILASAGCDMKSWNTIVPRALFDVGSFSVGANEPPLPVVFRYESKDREAIQKEVECMSDLRVQPPPRTEILKQAVSPRSAVTIGIVVTVVIVLIGLAAEARRSSMER